MDSTNQPYRSMGGLSQVGARLRTWWPAKMLGTSVAMAAFFVAYFWVLQHPLFSVTTMPLTAVDRLIGFRPDALVLYASLWLYVSLVPALLIDRREIVIHCLGALGLSVIGLGIFLLWPTTVSRPDIGWSHHPVFAFLATVDASGNACPSLHAAFAVFTAVWIEHLLRQLSARRLMGALNWLWCGGILFSTVATGQHVALDALAGGVLGAIVGIVSLRMHRAASGSLSAQSMS